MAITITQNTPRYRAPKLSDAMRLALVDIDANGKTDGHKIGTLTALLHRDLITASGGKFTTTSAGHALATVNGFAEGLRPEPMTVTNVEMGVAGGWRVVTFGQHETRVTTRELHARVQSGEWVLTEDAKYAAQRASAAAAAR